MNLRADLLRYLSQRAELGDAEFYLETLDADALRSLLARVGSEAPGRRGGAVDGDVAYAEAAPEGAGAAVRERVAGCDVAYEAAAEGAGAAVRGRVADGDVAYEAPVRETAADPAAALAALGAEASGCTKCRLCETRTQVVFGDGVASADVMVVGEAPGADEDRTGVPFVGRAGRMLDLMLMAVGFPRERVYICNVLKCRPPQNRDPQADEVASCTPYLKRQIEIIRPSVLLAVGRFAAQVLTGSESSLGRLRRDVHSYAGVPVVVTYHPAYLLRSPDQTRKAWEDMQMLRAVVERAGGVEG